MPYLIGLYAICRVTAVGLTYGDAQGVYGTFHNGSDRLAGLLNRIKVLEMPLLFAPSEGWCYVGFCDATHSLPTTTLHAGYIGIMMITEVQSQHWM